MKFNDQSGISSLLTMILVGSGVLLAALGVQSKRTNDKAKEVQRVQVRAIGKRANLTALSYLFSSMERSDVNVAAEIKYDASQELFQGRSDKYLSLNGPIATYRQVNMQDLSEDQVELMFKGKASDLWQEDSSHKKY